MHIVERTIPEKRSSANGKVVLVIDDTDDMLLLSRTILELDGFKVLTAQGGSEALAILSQIIPPDLILLDLQMHGMSGPEVLNLIEAKHPNILNGVPIVFLTAMDEIPPSKAAGFIRKPIACINTFVTTVHRFIDTAISQHQYKH